jgi:hypothetical protein
LIKVPSAPTLAAEMDGLAATLGVGVRFGIGANVSWLYGPEDSQELLNAIDQALIGLDLSAVMVRGRTDRPILGRPKGTAFLARVKSCLDPEGKFRGY